jgi:sugar phosphate isomerase/epimerase
VFKCALGDRDAVAEHLEILKRCLDLCGELAAPVARVFTFWKPGAPGAPADAGLERPWEDARSAVTDRLADAVRIAEDFDATVVVENEPSVYASTCAKVAEVLRRLGHPRAAAVWDPGNAVFGAEKEPPYPDGYESLRPHLRHVHVKDARRHPADAPAAAVRLGDGAVPYPDIFTRLIKDGYEGFASLETHYRVTGRLSVEATRLPGGAEFSAGGYDASAECLARWNEMLSTMGAPARETEGR